MAIMIGRDSFGDEVYALDTSSEIPEMYHVYYCKCGLTERNGDQPTGCTCSPWDVMCVRTFYKYDAVSHRDIKFNVETSGSVRSDSFVTDTYRTRVWYVSPQDREVRERKARYSKRAKAARRMSRTPL